MPSPLETNAPSDFDFIIGDWTVEHRRLNACLQACHEWTACGGRSSTVKTLGGFGKLEDNILDFPDGRVRARAMRSYCRETGTWSIWWLDGRNPTALDVPVVGRFSGGVGLFFADDVQGGWAVC